MKEFSAFMSRVNLDGADGCAEVDVRCKVPITEARRLSRLMLTEGHPIRVLFPETLLEVNLATHPQGGDQK